MAKSKEEGKVSKMEAVRQTLASGIEKPIEGIASIKEKFGIDIPAQIFSSYKSQINAKAGKPAGKRGRKPKAAVEGQGGIISSGPTTPKKKIIGVENRGVELARDVKKLVETYGADAVKGMADVFSE